MNTDLRAKLKTARKILGLTQSSASREWGIPLRTLISWENSQRMPSTLALAAINRLLNGILETNGGPCAVPSTDGDSGDVSSCPGAAEVLDCDESHVVPEL